MPSFVLTVEFALNFMDRNVANILIALRAG
jgi:hypothetical protein